MHQMGRDMAVVQPSRCSLVVTTYSRLIRVLYGSHGTENGKQGRVHKLRLLVRPFAALVSEHASQGGSQHPPPVTSALSSSASSRTSPSFQLRNIEVTDIIIACRICVHHPRS